MSIGISPLMVVVHIVNSLAIFIQTRGCTRICCSVAEKKYGPQNEHEASKHSIKSKQDQVFNQSIICKALRKCDGKMMGKCVGKMYTSFMRTAAL